MDHARLRVVLLAVFAAVLLCLTQSFGLADDDDKHIATIAIIDFGYVDTSGEVRDQQGEHAARLMNFMNALKGGLAKRNKIRIIAPACMPEPCSTAHSSEGNLLNAARAAGADLLLVGGIHKMSTLVQWAEVKAIDVKSGQIVFDRLFTFRGDTDLAWRHAEEYMEATISDEVAKSTLSR
jgi:Protein of unknown function (DUF2380)